MAHFVAHRLFFISLFVTSSVLGLEPFGYGQDNGPEHWHEEYQTCLGKHQSPINIEEHNVESVTLSPLKFVGLEKDHPAYILNNGHTVMLRLNESEPALISGGPLGNSEYAWEQLHFHWGQNDKEGSEDLINNHSFALELHAVFYKQEYGSIGEAVNHPDGLAVFAYFFEVSNTSNSVLDSIIKSVPAIEEVNTYRKLQEPLELQKLLTPEEIDVQSYFTYHGSLTTPPCLEVVTWVDFKDPLFLSHTQIAAFRDIKGSEGEKLVKNFRPVQPLEGRTVYYNRMSLEPSPEDNPEENGQDTTTDKNESDNDVDVIFKDDDNEDADKFTTEEIEQMQEQHAAENTSGTIQMVVHAVVTLSTFASLFMMR